MLLLLALAAVVGVALGSMTADERRRLLELAISAARVFAYHARRRAAEDQWFRDALRARTRRVLATGVILFIQIATYLLVRVGAAGRGSRAAMLDWGASFGPRTTGGEWWRLGTSMFVQPSLFGLLVCVGALVTVGFLVERYLGSAAFLGVYVTGGILAGVVNLWRYPVAVCGGAAGSIFALYGLLLGSFVWNFPQRRADDGDVDGGALAMPPGVVRRLVPAAVLFVAYSAAYDGLAAAAELAAMGAGLVAGLIVSTQAGERKPAVRAVAATALATVVAAAALAVPVRGIADVLPEMDRIVALEQHTAATYDAATARVKRGRAGAAVLVDVIEQAILPELRAADVRLKALKRVPSEHQPLVDDAERYVQLRSASWTLRAEGLRTAGVIPARETEQATPSSSARWRLRAEAMFRKNAATLGKAETAERTALDALRQLDSARRPS